MLRLLTLRPGVAAVGGTFSCQQCEGICKTKAPPGQVLCASGKPLTETYFPLTGMMVALLVMLRDGNAVEATIIGQEGVFGGIVTSPDHPSFAKAIAQVPGRCVRIATSRVQGAKEQSAMLGVGYVAGGIFVGWVPHG